MAKRSTTCHSGRRPKRPSRSSKSKGRRRPAQRTTSKIVSLSTILNKRAPKTLAEARVKGFENVVRENPIAAEAQTWQQIHDQEQARVARKEDPLPSRIYIIEKHIQDRVRDDLKKRLRPDDPRRAVGLEINPELGYRQQTVRANGELQKLWYSAHYE